MTKANPNIVVFGAGAVGSTVGGWLAGHHPQTWLLDQPVLTEVLNQRGLTLYLGGDKAHARTVPVKAINELKAAPSADVVIVAVKNYSLDRVAQIIKAELGDAPIILALQNGVDNQVILPKYFSKVIYGIVSYNAWIDEPGVVGFQKHGPLVIGTLRGELAEETKQLAALLGRGVETVVTERIADAAYSKMVINLTNSLQALIGHPLEPISDKAAFQKVLTHLTYEGVQIVKAAGHKECRLGGMPRWSLMWAAATLPPSLTRRAFDKNVKKMVMSSMAQDVLQRGGKENELETINGHFLELADRFAVNVPYNRAVYRLCKERFGKPEFQPLAIEAVLAAVANG